MRSLRRNQGPFPSTGRVSLWLTVAIAIVLSPLSTRAQQTGTLEGRITSGRTMQPLAGAQILVVGTQIGTLSQEDGRFLVPDVPSGTVEVSVTMIGYQIATQPVTIGDGETATLDLTLEPRAIDLDEIVVTGTAGAARRREIGNSVSVLRSDQIRDRPVVTMDDVFSGSVTGLNVLRASGNPGASADIRIRGSNSVTQANAPLIYIDGVRTYNGNYQSAKGGQYVDKSLASGPGASSSVLNDINPEDIERVEVIKGAAATTLYGTEAAGGVIQVFTKSGAGLPQDTTIWSASITQGAGIWQVRTGPASPSQAMIEAYGPNVESLWLKPWLRTGHLQSYNLSARGRQGDASYFVAGGWEKDQGVLPKEEAEEWSLRANFSFRPTTALNLDFTNSLVRRHVVWISNGSNAEGFFNAVMRGPFDGTEDQDERALEFDFDDFQTHLTSGLTVSFQPTAGFDVRGTFGFDLIDQENLYEAPWGSWFVPDGERGVRNFRNQTMTFDLRSTYRREIGRISTTTSIGVERFDNEFSDLHASSNGFPGPHRASLGSGGERDVLEARLRQVTAGFFLQETLGFADKVFLTGGLRVDGSSTFGENLGLQGYPKLSGSYVISEEGFWPEFFDHTKLRAAYGESGKAPGYFDAEKVWQPVQAKEGESGLSPDNRGNPNLGPERTREVELGLEASAFDGRVGIDFTYYRQRTVDALIPVAQDPTLGFLGSQLENIGELENRGIELALTAEPIRTPGFAWQLSLNYSTNESEVLDVGDGPPISLGDDAWIRRGYPIGVFAEKVTNPNEIADPVLAVDPDPTFGTDVFLGPILPTRQYSASTSFRIGNNLQIHARGEFQGGHVRQSDVSESGVEREVWPACYDITQAMKAGNLSGITAQERFNCDTNPLAGAHTHKVDFFRLREVSLVYEVPARWTPYRLSDLSLAFGVTNLFLISDYGGFDPENKELDDYADRIARWEDYNLPPITRFNFTIRTSF